MRVEQLLAESARRFSDLPAIIAGRSRHSFTDLDLKSGRLALAIAQRGVTPGERIALFMESGPAAIVAAFAVLKAGAILLLVDHRLPAEPLTGRLAGAVGIVTEARLAQTTAAALGRTPSVRLVVLSGADRATARGNCLSLEEATAGIGTPVVPLAGTPADLAVELDVRGVDGSTSTSLISHGELIAAARSAEIQRGSAAEPSASLASEDALYRLINAIAGGVTQVMEPAAARLGAMPRGGASTYRLAG